ncbi:MAG: hypothetical protein K1X66_01825 [Verrucomicrobiae bacterium]|nr:hypothetical protein [Verrucomicrobiae bacterium]
MKKKDNAERFIKWIRNLWKDDPKWEEPPEKWKISLSDFTLIELGTIVLYNGAQGIPPCPSKDDYGVIKNIRSPWQFDPSKPSGQRWKFYDNINKYTEKVIKDEWEHEQPTVE